MKRNVSPIKYLFLILFLGIFFSLQTNAQIFQIIGDRTFGGNQSERNPQMVVVDSTHLIIVAHTRTNLNGDKTDPFCNSFNPNESDIWMLKIDTAFNIIWDKSIGGNKAEELNPRLTHNFLNNEVWISVGSPSDSSCEKSENSIGLGDDYWIYASDFNGTKKWDLTFGSTEMDYYNNTIQLSSGNTVICGISSGPISGDKTVAPIGVNFNDYWVVKIDSLGNVLWDKVYGGINAEVSDQSGIKIIPSEDDGFVLAGSTDSPAGGSISDTCRGLADIWIIKIDSLGNKIWDKRYGGNLTDVCNHISKTNDNGYILCGESYSAQGLDVSDPMVGGGMGWVVKLDSLGNKLWDKRYGGDTITGVVTCEWIERAPEGGYLISGKVYGNAGFDVSEPAYGTQEDFWIFKIDSMGNKLWDKRFGGPSVNWGTRFVIMPDSSIFVYGTAWPGINAVKTDSGKGNDDIWVIHFRYIDTITSIPNSPESTLINLFPNPSSGIINIPEKLLDSRMMVFDISGRLVHEIAAIRSKEINLEHLPNGCYLFEFTAKNNRYQGKWIKM